MRKSLFEKKGILAIILGAVYIIGLAAGLFAVAYYPIGIKHRDMMIEGTKRIAEMPPQDMNWILSSDSTSRIFRYNELGTCILSITPDDPSPDGYLIYGNIAARYVPEILRGKDVFAIIPQQGENRTFFQYCTLAGVPVFSGENITGAVLLIRNLENIQESVTGFLIYFTVLYWLAAYIIVKYIRKRKKLEEIQQNYIANVTHALKTPIASIKIIAETLSDVDGLDDNKQRMYYGQIINETNVQGHMVQEMLDLAKIQSMEMDFSKTQISAEELFDPVLEKYRVICECAGIDFRTPENYDELPRLYTNAACVRQVLENLLSNAVKYVDDEGKISFEITDVSKSGVLFCVRDNGKGISKEDLPHIFERFYRCSRTANKSGSGLGLAICKEIMTGLKEKLYAESSEETGTGLYFTVKV